MNSLGKKAGYLKGLMEGLSFSDPAQEKVMQAMADLLGDLCDRVEAVDDLLDDLNDYVESIDDDLAELEGDRDDEFHMIDDDEFEDDYLDDMDNASDRLHLIGGKDDAEREDSDDDADADEDEDGAIAGAVCPDCGQPFFVSLDDPEGARYVCPHCSHRVTPELLTPENAPVAKPVEDDN